VFQVCDLGVLESKWVHFMPRAKAGRRTRSDREQLIEGAERTTTMAAHDPTTKQEPDLPRSNSAPSGESHYEKLRIHPDERLVKWRFHRAADQRWRWQKIAGDQTVIAESSESYATFSQCAADATSAGYKHLPSTEGLQEPR
jgi:hypothetical protein